MADHFRTDLHQLLPQRRERPVLDLLRQRKRPHEVGEIAGQDVKLEPNLVVAELAARQPRPLDRVLAFLDVLLRFAALIVERQPNPLHGVPSARYCAAFTRRVFLFRCQRRAHHNL